MAAIALSSTSSSLANTTSLLTRLSFLSSVHHLALTLSPPLRISLNSPANARAIRAVTNSATKNAAAAEKKPPAQPRYSKAARRYFNDTFGEKPQRLAKVLAAAGGYTYSSFLNSSFFVFNSPYFWCFLGFILLAIFPKLRIFRPFLETKKMSEGKKGHNLKIRVIVNSILLEKKEKLYLWMID